MSEELLEAVWLAGCPQQIFRELRHLSGSRQGWATLSTTPEKETNKGRRFSPRLGKAYNQTPVCLQPETEKPTLAPGRTTRSASCGANGRISWSTWTWRKGLRGMWWIEGLAAGLGKTCLQRSEGKQCMCLIKGLGWARPWPGWHQDALAWQLGISVRGGSRGYV